MRALFVSRNLPDDPAINVHGIFKRMGLFIEAVLELVDELDMLFYVMPSFDTSPERVSKMEGELRSLWGSKINLFLARRALPKNAESTWRQYGAGIFSVFSQENYAPMSGQEQIAAFEACLDRKPDWIFAHRLHAMSPLMRTSRPLPPIFLDLDDIEHRAHFRRVIGFPRWPGERLKVLHTASLFIAERRAIRMTEGAFVCSDLDRDYMRKWVDSNNLVTIPNSVAIPSTLSAIPESPNLLFLGSFLHPPNVVAADYMVEKIWPLIRVEVPDATLTIAGAESERTRNFSAPPAGVVYAGFVKDLAALYEETRVVCCPILSGAGTRIKIVEAAAYGRPIVSTTLGAEGLEFEDGRAILLRDDPRAFAEACVRLLRDRSACEAMGALAYREAKARYDRIAVINGIVSQIREGLAVVRAR